MILKYGKVDLTPLWLEKLYPWEIDQRNNKNRINTEYENMLYIQITKIGQH